MVGKRCLPSDGADRSSGSSCCDETASGGSEDVSGKEEDEDEDSDPDACGNACDFIHVTSQKSEAALRRAWQPPVLALACILGFYLVLALCPPRVPFLLTAVYVAMAVGASRLQGPSRHFCFMVLSSAWFLYAFPGSYSWLWGQFAPLPAGGDLLRCPAADVFGKMDCAHWECTAFMHSPYHQGTCWEPVCGFAFRRDPGQLRMHPTFVVANHSISGLGQLPPACRRAVENNTMTPDDSRSCSAFCAKVLPRDLHWRFALHYLIPYCSGIAGWGQFDGGALYLACGRSALALTWLHPVACYFLAALYSTPLLLALVREHSSCCQAHLHPDRHVRRRLWGPSSQHCEAFGRFPRYTLRFPWCFVPVASDMQAEQLSCFHEAFMVILDAPTDLLACLTYLRAGHTRMAMMLVLAVIATGDPLQTEGARALISRCRQGYASRHWWVFRAKKGVLEGTFSGILAVFTLATASVEHDAIPIFVCQAITSLHSASNAAEAVVLLRLDARMALDLQDYYAVVNVRSMLRSVKLSAVCRILSTAWMAAFSDTAGRDWLKTFNVAVLLLEAAAGVWDSSKAHRELAFAARSFRYWLVAWTLGLVAASSTWAEFSWAFLEGYRWDCVGHAARSLAKALCLLVLGPLALLAAPALDFMGHLAVRRLPVTLQAGTSSGTGSEEEGESEVRRSVSAPCCV